MRIGIIGAGNIGSTLGGLWAKAGHAVMLSSRHPEELKGLVESLGPKASAGTPAEAVRHVLDLCDMVVVMRVNPGFGGQKFIHSQVEKIAALRAMIGDRPIHIEIDGGITPETAPLAVAAGADVLVAGSAVFAGGSVSDPAPYGRNIWAIRRAANGALLPA